MTLSGLFGTQTGIWEWGRAGTGHWALPQARGMNPNSSSFHLLPHTVLLAKSSFQAINIPLLESFVSERKPCAPAGFPKENTSLGP